MAKSVTIEVDTASGSIAIAEGAMFLGEEAPVSFTGYIPATGNTLFLTLFADDRVTPVADNSSNAGIIDLRHEELLKQFRGIKANRQFFAQVIEKTVNGTFTGQVLASGNLQVMWSPSVYEATTGSFATMKGEKGDQGEQGIPGRAANISAMIDANGRWHKVILTKNDLDEDVLAVDPEETTAGYPYSVENETLYLNGKED